MPRAGPGSLLVRLAARPYPVGMLRKLLTFANIVSAIVCVLATALLLVSLAGPRLDADEFRRTGRRTALSPLFPWVNITPSLTQAQKDANKRYEELEALANTGKAPGLSSSSVYRGYGSGDTWIFFGVDIDTRNSVLGPERYYSTSRVMWINLPAIAITTALLPVLARGVLWLVMASPVSVVERRRRAGRCLRCGYDLRASPERCPECGSTAAGNRPPPVTAGRGGTA